MPQSPQDLDLSRIANGVDHRAPLQARQHALGQRTGTVLRTEVDADAYELVATVVQSTAGRFFAHGVGQGMDTEPRCRQDLRDLRIGFAVVGIRALGLVPQTDPECLRAACGHEGNLVLETLLLPKHRDDFLLQLLGQLRADIGLQLHGDPACKHGNLLRLSRPRGLFQITQASLARL